MAQDTPVLALVEMATKEVLLEGEGGRIAPDDPVTFAAIAAELLEAPEARARLSAMALAHAHTWRADRMAERMGALYAHLVGRVALAAAT